MSDTPPPPPPPYLPPPPPSPVYGGTIPPVPPGPPSYGGGSPLYPASTSFEPFGPPSRSGKATAGFVLGLVSIVLFFSLVVPILAIVFGLLGAKEVKRSAGRLKSMAFARIGWIFGALALIGGAALWIFVAIDIAGTTSVFDLKVGDCVELPSASTKEVSRLETFDCNEPHDAEVFAAGELKGGDDPYPGDDAVAAMISKECRQAFDEYVGGSVAQTKLEARTISPTEENWHKNQQYLCLAYDPNGDLTESIEDSGR